VSLIRRSWIYRNEVDVLALVLVLVVRADGYPHEAAAEVAVRTVKEGLENDKDGKVSPLSSIVPSPDSELTIENAADSQIKGVTFVQFDNDMQDIYKKVMRRWFADDAR
jgi:hypothetical protein